MAKANQFINATRTIKVPLTFEDESGERKTEEFAIKYRSYSPKVAREMAELEKAEGSSIPRSLARLIVSIPEITNGDNEPVEITEENLSEFSNDNLEAMYAAIVKDIRPTQAPTTPSVSPATSETRAAAQS
jgi:hypothetical protein